MTIRPDIFIFIADDAHSSNFGFMPDVEGPHAGLTPNLNRMAREGTVLTNWQHASVVCSTSRVGMLTGTIPATFGMHTTVGTGRNVVDTIPTDILDLFTMLTGAGYFGGLWGKNHTGVRWHERGIYRYGWADPDGHYPPEAGPDFAAPLNGSAPIWRDTNIGNDAGDWLHKSRLSVNGRFGVLAYHSPHKPLRAPAQFQDPLSSAFKGAARPFFGSIVQMDSSVGKVMQKIRAGKRPTIVLFISDNAQLEPTLASMDDQISLGGKRRGRKGEPGSGGTTGPGIVWTQGIADAAPGGTVNDAYISGLDILPSIAAMLEIEPPAGLDGENMLPALLGHPQQRTKPLFWLSTQPEAATRHAAHDFPAIGCLFEGIGVRAYAETDMSDFHAYRLSDITELDRMQNEMNGEDTAHVIGGMARFVERCRTAGCPI